MKTINELKEDLKNAENLEKEMWLTDTTCNTVYIYDVAGKKYISYQCASIDEMKSILSKFEPYKTEFNVGVNNIVVCSPYNCTIQNNYYERKLKISFELINNVVISATIDFNDMTSDFRETFFTESLRGLYDSETIYVNIPSHYKKFKSIRVKSFNFKSTVIGFYGGSKVANEPKFIGTLINYILNV